VALLKLIRGGAVGQLLPLNGDRMVLGRHPTCQIVLDNAAVSRQHAQILENHGTHYLEDLRSRNGTQLNNETIRGRVELKEGDQIGVCDFVFQYLLTSSATAVATTAPVPQSEPPSVVRARQRPTAEVDSFSPFHVPEPAALDDPAASSSSSILASVEADSIQTIRLHVRPEVKLKAVLEITSVLGRELRFEKVLPLILDALFKIFPQADWGFILLKDVPSGKLTVRSSKSRRTDDEDSIPISMTIVEQALDGGKAILSADASRDRRFASSESLMELQIRSVMCAPLIEPGGSKLGVIQVSTRDLGQPFTSEDLELLASICSQCALAVQNAVMHETLLEQRDIERELDFATQVQIGFLPNQPPALSGYEFADYYEPAHRVGGDYFDYIRLPNGHVAVAVGDVAGKGVPAALLMARLHASARYHLLSALTASEALTSLNSEISTSGLGFRFITLVLAVINPDKHELRIANAGHLPPLLRSVDGTVVSLGQRESGMPLGVMPRQNYRETVLPLAAGDTLLFYTDGVTEAMDASQEIYGRERLAATFRRAPTNVRELVPFLVDDVEKFFGDRNQRDDLCVVAFRRSE
jgi:sigma-B regulation protein RsbU (phosphoserine phosphatase)